MKTISQPMLRELADRWTGGWARDGQVAPDGDWRIWVIRAGRGFGKTRAGAEWVTALAEDKTAAIALVGSTEADVRRVMIDGPSGLRAVAKTGKIPRYTRARGEVRWPNGAVAYVYSADAPEQLRGPEHSAAWCDELAKWRRGEAAWDNLMMGLRRGASPRVLVTTTPRPTNLMKRVLRSKGLVETRGATRDNPFLPDAFVTHVEDGASLAQGTNLALVGDELIQFERAEPLGNGRWALTGLRRGLRGTEAAIGTQATGDRFALLERDGVVSIDLPVSAIGRNVRVLASGVGDVQAPVAATIRVAGASVVPPAPVHLAVRVDGDGARRLVWVRRSRAGWGWNDRLDAPLVEEAERYRVIIMPDDGAARTVEVDRAEVSLGDGDRPAWATIVQLGTFGASSPARVRIV